MSSDIPDVMPASRDNLVDDIVRRQPGYVPEATPKPESLGMALTRVFAQQVASLAAGLNQMPEQAFRAFLSTLGIHFLAAQAARAPVVFSLVDKSPVDVTLPANSQVAAVLPPPAPKPGGAGESPAAPPPVIFSTTQTVTLSRATLAVLYSIDPGSDAFANHSAILSQGFTLFDNMQPTEHIIYLGHDVLFALAGNITVLLGFTLDKPASSALDLTWEYFTDFGWMPLTAPPDEDTTGGLQTDGQLALYHPGGPNAKQTNVGERTSYWIRGRVQTPLVPGAINNGAGLPVVDTIRTRVSFGRTGILPDAAFSNSVPLDTTKNFYPFGQQPGPGDTFYLACKEVFGRQGAQVTLHLTLLRQGIVDIADPTGVLALKWEYHNGTSWEKFTPDLVGYDLTTQQVAIAFVSPSDWSEATVNSVKNHWLRAQITQGSYGHPVRPIPDPNDPTKVILDPPKLNPPSISNLTLDYSYSTDPAKLDYCLAYNDFQYQDDTEACRWPNEPFTPFHPVADQQPTVHFGFDEPLPEGLVSLYVDAQPSSDEDTTAVEGSPYVWEYWGEQGWTQLSVRDETIGFHQRGMVQFIGPPDGATRDGLGKLKYRVRARLKPGETLAQAPLGGVWLNAVWAENAQQWPLEPLGRSDGNPGQSFSTQHRPVLDKEMVEIQEWTGRGDAWQTLLGDIPDEDVRVDRDPVTGQATTVWVRWRQQRDLYRSSSSDRYYTVEPATGLVSFGDGQHGRIPPAGRPIVISYRSGGGAAANVAAGAVSQVRTALPLITGATNPVAASGGADIEPIDAVRRRGPQRLRNGDRAVSAADFEWLAHEASPGVARARCLPVTGPAGFAQRGWVSLMIVPYSPDPQPQPSPELIRQVQNYVSHHGPATAAKRIRIISPRYTQVGVVAEVIPQDASAAAAVEGALRDRLDAFLHPLTGGREGRGWDFGEAVHLSQVAQVIETTPGVDHARRITLHADGHVFDDFVPLDANGLVSAGKHELTLMGGDA